MVNALIHCLFLPHAVLLPCAAMSNESGAGRWEAAQACMHAAQRCLLHFISRAIVEQHFLACSVNCAITSWPAPAPASPPPPHQKQQVVQSAISPCSDLALALAVVVGACAPLKLRLEPADRSMHASVRSSPANPCVMSTQRGGLSMHELDPREVNKAAGCSMPLALWTFHSGSSLGVCRTRCVGVG